MLAVRIHHTTGSTCIGCSANPSAPWKGEHGTAQLPKQRIGEDDARVQQDVDQVPHPRMLAE
jgi:hypothetical protein